MIRFKRNDSRVYAEIEHGIFDNTHFSVTVSNEPYPYQAELFMRHLEKQMAKKLSEIQEKYYKEGWKDAKAKTKKRTSFFGSWKY